MWHALKPTLPLLLLFNLGIAAGLYVLHSDTLKPERELAAESAKAIAWVVTTPACEKHGFCYTIEEDRAAGALKHITALSAEHALSKGWTEVATTTGTYHIHGEPAGLHQPGEPVTLHTQKGGQRNVLCISATCYRVPFLP